MLPSSLEDCTPAQIKQAVDGGFFADLYPVGSLTALIPFVGDVVGQSFDMKIRCRVVHIKDGRPIFQVAQNESGREIALSHAFHSGCVPANGQGFCMNRAGQVGDTIDSSLDAKAKEYGPNKGGWEQCYCRLTLMPQVIACYPQEWQAIMRVSTIWTDNVGNGTNIASNITATQDTMYLPGYVEIYGSDYGYCNSATGTKQEQFDWHRAGNHSLYTRSDNPAQNQWALCRDPMHRATYNFCAIAHKAQVGTSAAASDNGMRPCFSV